MSRATFCLGMTALCAFLPFLGPNGNTCFVSIPAV